ncbi:transcriptional regulator, TetR family [Paenibacillus lactis 154]|uniref:Transcriptional regulator, TetR family n=2 Tax=Paenibacillus lactis TaxID=228574 RepID=G4HC46_9BACL|nr:transcriptional regulator, TetR family [Paenibacillus lactis 154]
MNGYQARTEMKKERIRKAALELFNKWGVEKVSLAQIAKHAEVSPVTIYNYFGTKPQLVRHVIITMLEEAWQQRIVLLQSNLPFHEKIEKMFFSTTEMAENVAPELLEPLLSNDPEIVTAVENIYRKYEPELISFIETGRDEGYVNPGVSSETILLYFTILKEVSAKIKRFDGSEEAARQTRELMEIVFYGFLVKPSR